MQLDKCPRCDRAGSAYCAELGRPCVPVEARPADAWKEHRRHLVNAARNRRKWRDAFDHGNREKIRRHWLRKADSTFNSTHVAALAGASAPNEITA
jgi:hypothetical protein